MAEGRAFVFPGQGSQFVGMGRELYEGSPKAAAIFDRASDILGFNLPEICFTGPEEKLKQTYVTQPAIFVHSYAAYMLLVDRGVRPDMVAGHSLGEYTALVAAGVLEFEAALRLVKKRGEAMQRAGELQPGTMAAVLGMEAEQVEALCHEARPAGIVQPANYNAPGQIVISGSHAGISRALALAPQRGARKAMALEVGGAFHSPLMAAGREALRTALEATEFREAQIPIYTNVTGKPERSARALKNLLDLQLISPVRWIETIENMIRDGAGQFYEIGPGRVLSGLIKRIDRKAEVMACGTPEAIAAGG